MGGWLGVFKGDAGYLPVQNGNDLCADASAAELAMNPYLTRGLASAHPARNYARSSLLEVDLPHIRLASRPRDLIEVLEQSTEPIFAGLYSAGRCDDVDHATVVTLQNGITVLFSLCVCQRGDRPIRNAGNLTQDLAERAL